MMTSSSGPRGSNALVERGRARAKLGDVVRDGCKAEVGRSRGGGGAAESGLEELKEGSRFISVRRWYKTCAPALAEGDKEARDTWWSWRLPSATNRGGRVAMVVQPAAEVMVDARRRCRSMSGEEWGKR